MRGTPHLDGIGHRDTVNNRSVGVKLKTRQKSPYVRYHTLGKLFFDPKDSGARGFSIEVFVSLGLNKCVTRTGLSFQAPPVKNSDRPAAVFN